MKKLLCLLLAAMLILSLAACAPAATPEPEPEPAEPAEPADPADPADPAEPTDPAESDPSAADPEQEGTQAVKTLIENYDPETVDDIVATYGEHSLDNLNLNYYYWLSFSGFYSTYSSYISYLLDLSAPLSTQNYGDGMSWQQFFATNAIQSWQTVMGYIDEAEKAGYEMPSDFAALFDTLEDDIAAAAAEQGFESIGDYFTETYGPASDFDTFRDFYWDYYYGLSYFESVYSDFIESHADDEPIKQINVRHVLIAPEDSADAASWLDAETKAQELLDSWDGTEDGFAALANEHSTDTGSNTNGGLYENVYPGQMVTTFNDWCFDASRQPGDTGIVESEHGYHIMYFSGLGDDYADSAEYYASQDIAEWGKTTFADYTGEQHIENAVIYLDFGSN